MRKNGKYDISERSVVLNGIFTEEYRKNYDRIFKKGKDKKVKSVYDFESN